MSPDANSWRAVGISSCPLPLLITTGGASLSTIFSPDLVAGRDKDAFRDKLRQQGARVGHCTFGTLIAARLTVALNVI
jgi:hypothetical protein